MFPASDQMMFQWPPRPLPMERKWKSNIELAPHCPRCASTNTKFCYYNNYSLSQPRYFCKGCRRYWTKGGSLRNVPVGGGCRKNGRANSARFSANERVASMKYSRHLNGLDTRTNEPLSNTCSLNENSMAQESATKGSDIDLAVVFAKLSNQDSSLELEVNGRELPKEANELVIVSNSLNPDSGQSDAMIECHMPSDSIQDSDFLEGLTQMLEREKQQGEERIEEFIECDMNALGLQTLFNDEMVQDALWSDAANFPNISCQPMVRLQEFDSFLVDDQLNITANLMGNNNWSSFDISGFEAFPRP